VKEVRNLPPLVQFSADMKAQSTALKTFLLHQLYRHPQVLQTTEWAKQVVSELFEAYVADPQAMPDSHAQRDNLPRAVADYIAGMTDRFASREHARLTGKTAPV
jgi:dGTPase